MQHDAVIILTILIALSLCHSITFTSPALVIPSPQRYDFNSGILISPK